uniref:Uncharacterized protein n=1 Tax=Oryza sativa subsp. japonica TaxID=39947 RepID=Q5VNG5_ORYSJ|nr:hypothetical protein [Oryza sativa Japonica Group]
MGAAEEATASAAVAVAVPALFVGQQRHLAASFDIIRTKYGWYGVKGAIKFDDGIDGCPLVDGCGETEHGGHTTSSPAPDATRTCHGSS